MSDVKTFMVQVYVDDSWQNYEICYSLSDALEFCFGDLSGFLWRVLGYYREQWVEYLACGSMRSVEYKDFRVLPRKGVLFSA